MSMFESCFISTRSGNQYCNQYKTGKVNFHVFNLNLNALFFMKTWVTTCFIFNKILPSSSLPSTIHNILPATYLDCNQFPVNVVSLCHMSNVVAECRVHATSKYT